MNINWTPPEPRRGLLGEWDKLIGPGQSWRQHLEFVAVHAVHILSSRIW
jgi:hypothetical protein